MSITKMGFHVVGGSRHGYGDVARSGPAVIKSVNEVGAFDELPAQTLRIYRNQHIMGDSGHPNLESATMEECRQAAYEHWDAIKRAGSYARCHYMQLINETGGNNEESVRKVIAMQEIWMDLCDRDQPGFKIAIGGMAGGSPGDNQTTGETGFDFWVRVYVPLIERAGRTGHIYNRHAYGGVPKGTVKSLTRLENGRVLPATAAVKRVFDEAKYLLDHNIFTPIIVTEAGQDGGYHFVGTTAFVEDAIRFDELCQQYPNIHSFCLWTYGDWRHANIQQASSKLAAYLKQYDIPPLPYEGVTFSVPITDNTPTEENPTTGAPEAATASSADKARLGLHMGADGGHISQEEIEIFRALQPSVIKALSSHSVESIRALTQIAPNAHWIVRAFLDFRGRAHNKEQVSSQQFYQWTIDDVLRNIRAIGKPHETWVELHNEVNLHMEGACTSWQDECDFNNWLLDVLRLYKERCQQEGLTGIRFMFPGLSPGGDIPNVRIESNRFLEECRQAIEACDGLGQHIYWAQDIDVEQAIQEAVDMVRRFPNKPIWITEASNNRCNSSSAQKAQEYGKFWQGLRRYPQIQGVTYFIASASDPMWQWQGIEEHHCEVWTGTNIAQLIGNTAQEEIVEETPFINMQYIVDGFKLTPNLDLDAVPAGVQFTVQWQFQHPNYLPWGEGYKFQFAGNGANSAALTAKTTYDLLEVATVDAQGRAIITLSMTAPKVVGKEYQSKWLLYDPQGRNTNYVYIQFVTTFAPVEPKVSNSLFLDDRTVPDFTTYMEGESFNKQWLVRNTGATSWDSSFRLVHVAGDATMANNRTSHPVPPAAPGEEVIISIPMIAPPARSEIYYGMWRLQDNQNQFFGDVFWIKIYSAPSQGEQPQPEQAPPSIMFRDAGIYSQLDSRWYTQKLGHGTATIGSWGCLMTCHSMMLTAFGDSINPAEMNQRLLNAGGFVGKTSNIWFTSPSKVNSNVVLDKHYRLNVDDDLGNPTEWIGEQPFQRINEALRSNKVVLAQVDSSPADNQYSLTNDQHWVILTAQTPDGADYRIIDPIIPPAHSQQISLMSKYGNPLAHLSAHDNLSKAIKSVLIYSFKGAIPSQADGGHESTSSLYTGPRWPYGRLLHGCSVVSRQEDEEVPANLVGRFDTIRVNYDVSLTKLHDYQVRKDFYLARLYVEKPTTPLAFVREVSTGIHTLVNRGVTHFELHSEPNLTHSGFAGNGMGGAWADGKEFAKFFVEAKGLLQKRWSHIQVGFPGLAPGGDGDVIRAGVVGWRRDSQAFLDEALRGRREADFVCVHAYYEDLDSVYEQGVKQVEMYRERYRNQLLFVSQFGNSNPEAIEGDKATARARFVRLCRTVPGVAAAYHID